MQDPLTAARQVFASDITGGAETLGSGSSCSPDSLRFRPDGNGGELATPYPLQAQIRSELLVKQLKPHIWCERVYPSGDWLALDLSEAWRETVRQYHPAFTALTAPALPIPDFPARIDPVLWCLDVQLGVADPCIAARQDRGNPAWLIRHTMQQAEKNTGKNHPSRQLVNEAALGYLLLSDKSPQKLVRLLHTISRHYMADPAEDILVAGLLRCGIAALTNLQQEKNH